MKQPCANMWRVAISMLFILVCQSHVIADNDKLLITAGEGTEIKAKIRGKTATLRVAGCPDLSGMITVGKGDFSIDINLSRALVALQPDDDDFHRDDMCHYVGSSMAAVTVETSGLGGAAQQGAFSLNPTISDLDISIYRKVDAKEDDDDIYPEVEFGWNDSGTDALMLPLKRWNIDFKVHSIGTVIKTNESGIASLSNSFMSIQMALDGDDVHLGGPVYLAGETDSLITYRWRDNAPSWAEGSWSVDGLAAVSLEIRERGVIPIASMALEIQVPSYDVVGTLDVSSEAEREVAGFKLKLLNSSLQARVNLKDGSWQLLGGAIDGELTAAAPLEGKLKVAIAWQQNSFRMMVASDSELKAFGAQCEDLSLAVNLNTESLTFDEIAGSASLTHKDFSDGNIAINSVVIKKGRLTEFLGAGRVGFKGFRLNISQASYTPADPTIENPPPSELILDARMDLGWQPGGQRRSGRSRSARSVGIAVHNLKIVDGEISSFGISGQIAADPMNVQFAAAYSREKAMFEGMFNGSFANTATVAGVVKVGVIPPPDDYTYGYLLITLDVGRGVPIGQSGLMLTGLRGGFGMNYDPKTGPQNNTYYLLGGLTVTDVARFGSLTGEIYVVLGATQRIGVKGTVQVTAGTPYFVGSVDANYVLGSGEVYGDITTTVKLPESGSIVSIDNNKLSYQVGNNRFSLQGQSLGGEVFSFIRLSRGRINLRNRLDRSISQMTGSIRGSMSGSNRLVWAYPDGYAPWGDGDGGSCNAVYSSGLELDCDCSDDTDSSWGFGLAGGFNAGLDGTLSADLTNAGIDGKFDVDVNLNGSVGVTTPGSGYFGTPCAFVKSVSAYGEVQGYEENGWLVLDGELRFSTSDGYSKNLDFKGYL